MLLASVVAVDAPSTFASSQATEFYHPEFYDLVDTRVTQVWTGGSWKLGDLPGRYRLILTENSEGIQHNNLFVEWIGMREVDEYGQRTIYALVYIELDRFKRLVFDLPECTDFPACMTFLLTAQDATTGETRSFKIILSNFLSKYSTIEQGE